MNETHTIGTIITGLIAALGLFLKNIVMLVSNHEKQMAEEKKRTADAEQRSDRLMEIVIRAVGASEELVSIAKSRDVARDARDARESRGN